MLPSGIQPLELDVEKIIDGLYVVKNGYVGKYDFFAPSPLFKTVTTEESNQDDAEELATLHESGDGSV